MADTTYLVCASCGTRNSDPGGPPEHYVCGACGKQPLYRVAATPDRTGEAVAGTAIGGALGGAFFGPVGVLIGGLLGLIVASVGVLIGGLLGLIVARSRT